MTSCCNGSNAPLTASRYFTQLSEVLTKLPCNEIELLIEALLRTHNAGHAIFIFGNGGSAALASHIACDLGKGTAEHIPERVRVLSLTDNVPLMTAWANDTAFEHVFAEQLKCFVGVGDLAFAISGSGNSPNVLNALRVAREAGSTTAGLTGFQGGRMRQLCNICVIVPSDNMQIIEDAHTAISHGIFTALRARLQASQIVTTGPTVVAATD